MSAPTDSEPLRDEHAARAEHEAHRDVGEEVDEREVDRDEALRPHPRVAVAAGDLLEVVLVALLAHERLRHAHAGEALLQVRVHRAHALARDLVRLASTAAGTRASR